MFTNRFVGFGRASLYPAELSVCTREVRVGRLMGCRFSAAGEGSSTVLLICAQRQSDQASPESPGRVHHGCHYRLGHLTTRVERSPLAPNTAFLLGGNSATDQGTGMWKRTYSVTVTQTLKTTDKAICRRIVHDADVLRASIHQRKKNATTAPAVPVAITVAGSPEGVATTAHTGNVSAAPMSALVAHFIRMV